MKHIYNRRTSDVYVDSHLDNSGKSNSARLFQTFYANKTLYKVHFMRWFQRGMPSDQAARVRFQAQSFQQIRAEIKV